ncbi:DNA-directed RNA polymerase I subunit RPA34 [Vipera latastei]
MGPPGGEEAAAAGPARFQCPEEFCARRFAPGAALCAESLAAPGTRLLLIRAPADFRPESLAGRSLTLLGPRLLSAPQPDGSPRVYSLHGSREESGARLLVAAGRPGGLACAKPFSGCLRIQERYGEPGAARPLFPVAERPAPRVPGGLKQRFLPFGARLRDARPPWEAAGGAARKRSKKRPLLPLKQELWRPQGPEPLLGGSAEPAGGMLREPASAGDKRRLPKAEEAEATEPATLPAFGGRLMGPSEEGSWSGGEEAPQRRRAGKKEKKRKGSRETEGSPDPNPRYWQPERDPCLPEGGREQEGGLGDCGGEPELGRCKAKRRRKSARGAGAEGLWGVTAIKEEPVDVPCLGEEGLGAVEDDPAGELPGCRKKKRRREKGTEGLWGVTAVKEEPGDIPCLGSLPEEGLGSAREEPGGEFPGYIKQSPGKGAEGLWGVAALKEELGDIPSLGSHAEESLGAVTEDPAEELFSCKKKKKKKSRERVAEELWAVAALEEQPGDIRCMRSFPEGGLGSARGGPAGELLACKKKGKPLQERGTETQQLLEPLVQDWAAPLRQEAGPEQPSQTDGEAPKPRPKRRRRRREGEDQA